jgi:hypothetical protein
MYATSVDRRSPAGRARDDGWDFNAEVRRT